MKKNKDLREEVKRHLKVLGKEEDIKDTQLKKGMKSALEDG